jgi:hypothetical protein
MVFCVSPDATSMPWPWTATNAAECLGNQNGWDLGQFSNGITAAIGNVTRCRQTPQSSEKLAGSNTNHVLRIKKDHCFERPGRPTE